MSPQTPVNGTRRSKVHSLWMTSILLLTTLGALIGGAPVAEAATAPTVYMRSQEPTFGYMLIEDSDPSRGVRAHVALGHDTDARSDAEWGPTDHGGDIKAYSELSAAAFRSGAGNKFPHPPLVAGGFGDDGPDQRGAWHRGVDENFALRPDFNHAEVHGAAMHEGKFAYYARLRHDHADASKPYTLFISAIKDVSGGESQKSFQTAINSARTILDVGIHAPLTDRYGAAGFVTVAYTTQFSDARCVSMDVYSFFDGAEPWDLTIGGLERKIAECRDGDWGAPMARAVFPGEGIITYQVTWNVQGPSSYKVTHLLMNADGTYNTQFDSTLDACGAGAHFRSRSVPIAAVPPQQNRVGGLFDGAYACAETVLTQVRGQTALGVKVRLANVMFDASDTSIHYENPSAWACSDCPAYDEFVLSMDVPDGGNTYLRWIDLLSSRYVETYGPGEETYPRVLDKVVLTVAGVGFNTETRTTFGVDATVTIGKDDRSRLELVPFDESIFGYKYVHEVETLDARTPLRKTWEHPHDPTTLTFSYSATQLTPIRPGLLVEPIGIPVNHYGNPVPIAYLAAPPMVSGLGQDGAPSVLRQGTTKVNARGTSVEFHSGLTISAETPGLKMLPGTSASFSTGESKSDATTETMTDTLAISHEVFGSLGADHLALITHQFQSQHYKVHQSSFGGALQHFAVSRPLPGTIASSMSVESFLATESGRTYDLSALREGRQPGNPHTYATQASVDDECVPNSVVRTPDPEMVQTGEGGAASRQIELVRGTSTEEATTLTYDHEMSAKVLGVGAAASWGNSSGAFARHEVSNSVAFWGKVGHIPGDWSGQGIDETYRWGLAVCKATVPASTGAHLPLWFMNYWVEEYHGLGPVRGFGAITPLSPTDNVATGMQPTLRWTSANDIRGRDRLEVEALGADDGHIAYIPLPAGVNGAAQAMSWQPPADLLHPGVTYRWRVAHEHPDGQRSDPTTWRHFTPYATPAPLGLTRDPIQLDDGNVLFLLDGAEDPSTTAYDIDVRSPGGGQALVSETVDAEPMVIVGPLDAGTYVYSFTPRNPLGPLGSTLQVQFEVTSREADIHLTADAYETRVGRPVRVSLHAPFQVDAGQISWTADGATVRTSPGAPHDAVLGPAAPGVMSVEASGQDPDGKPFAVSTYVIVQDTPPTASMVGPSQVRTGEEARFELVADDVDPWPLGYAFGANLVMTPATNTAVFRSNEPGLHQVCGTAVDLSGHQTMDCAQILVENRPPQVSGLEAPAGLRTLEAWRPGATVSDEDASSTRTVFTTGDGRVGDAVPALHVFTKPGRYPVCVRAYDPQGAAAEQCVSVTVRNRPPVSMVDILTGGENQIVGRKVRFGFGGYDMDGPHPRVEWSGLAPYRVVGDVVEHTFWETGSHKICAQATDDHGAFATACTTVHVYAAPPEPAFDAVAEELITLVPIAFVDRSKDFLGGDIVSRVWTVDGQPIGSAPSVEHTFDRPGKHRVCVDVTDRWGLSAEGCQTLDIANRAPVSDFIADGYNVVSGHPVEFTSTAYDPDGPTPARMWVVDGTPMGTGETIRWSTRVCGMYDVELKVFDEEGAWDTMRKTIHVWTAYHEQEETAVDGVDLDLGPLASVRQPIPETRVPGTSVGVCEHHDPVVVVGEHDHDDTTDHDRSLHGDAAWQVAEGAGAKRR